MWLSLSKKSSWLRKSIIPLVAVGLLGASAFVAYKLLLQTKSPAPATTNETQRSAVPQLRVSTVISGLQNPWEVAFLPDQTMLITERPGAISKVVEGQKTVIFTPDDVAANGEGGMLGLAVDPEFSSNGFVYACFNSDLGYPDIRIVRWELNDAQTTLSDRQDIVTGIPANTSGRHSGCRIGFGPDGNLWIGTGDAAQSDNPQNLQSLGGKILRVDRDGKAVSGNLGSDSDPRIYSYGHRNTQGLAFYKAAQNGSYGFSVEHGSDRDDEINALVPGNFGWDPGVGYDESVAMTDTEKFPSAVSAFWSSGNPTIAPADAVILEGEQWGDWSGRIAMAVLKDKHLRLLTVRDGKISNEMKLFDGSYGRLRATTIGPDGSLYLSTDNSSDDKILKVTPVLE